MADRNSRTEEATPKRLRDSRRKGQVAKSNDFTTAVSFLAFSILISWFGRYVFTSGLGIMKGFLRFDTTGEISLNSVEKILATGSYKFAVAFIPFAAVAIATGVGAGLVQTGFVLSAEPLKPDFKKLNPVAGLKNMFSPKAVFNTCKNILKLGVVFFVTYKSISGTIESIANTSVLGNEKLFDFFIEILGSITINVALIILALGIIDLIYQQKDFKKNLRMTKQEVKQEHKETEGDPHVKSARMQRQRQLAMQRMMSEIETSSVVIANPTHIAIALRYEQGKDKAPVVTARGVDYMAQKIKAKAKEADVPIIEDKPLARMLYPKVEAGRYVPVELYQAVAEVLAMVYKMQGKKK